MYHCLVFALPGRRLFEAATIEGTVPAVLGTPCSGDCETDPSAAACATCCRAQRHEIDWQCGGEHPAECCLGGWSDACWNVASGANNGHPCNQCMGGAPTSFLGESCPTSVGDPITTYNGVSTRYWLPEGTELELFRLGDIAVTGTASRTPGYDSAKGEWLHVLRITRAGEAVLTVAVNHTANLTALSTALNKTTLAALAVRVGDAPLTGVGKQRYGNVAVVAAIDSRQGGIPIELMHVTVGDQLGLVIRSSVARKFADRAEQARHVHLDLAWTHIAREEDARGTLPEIWGLAPMSAATEGMLINPETRRREEPRRLSEEDCLPMLGCSNTFGQFGASSCAQTSDCCNPMARCISSMCHL